MSECEHTFVRPDLGTFICQDCGARFLRLPTDGKPRPPDSVIFNTMASFLDAQITFPEAYDKCGIRPEEFAEIFRKMLPKKFITEEVHTIGSSHSTPVVVGSGPRRTSNPDLVHQFFSQTEDLGKIVPQDLMKVVSVQFSDITTIDVKPDVNGDLECIITFVDETLQLVYLKVEDNE